jgi:transcriptional regulator with XRE-family HTH domain
MYYDQHVCGARIQELRKSKGYTQEALAEAIDIDAKRISKIERIENIFGKRPVLGIHRLGNIGEP